MDLESSVLLPCTGYVLVHCVHVDLERVCVAVCVAVCVWSTESYGHANCVLNAESYCACIMVQNMDRRPARLHEQLKH